ncbi:hypothetical protein CEUSTIGMA_g6563.t1 [Chlamydomonas eustigma]|uniref:UspA domain-containing protein n=1 Tax=Chlamydomonas eustigma TaxID=1157962 RepID=A0A250X7R8_9CHLO|nr:hypothetical protein CEUSTIGMA_g6563.t1 [Chlamydomonas eustigma]|eukprot:GAX79123.1 hypothetical protein CEUSTIGMA_g6563.t1 [Chlamydomonas eustigma]
MLHRFQRCAATSRHLISRVPKLGTKNKIIGRFQSENAENHDLDDKQNAVRNILVAVGAVHEDDTCALDWTIENMLRKGDQLHLVHCVPSLANQDQFFSIPSGRILKLPSLVGSPEAWESSMKTSWETRMEEMYGRKLTEAEVPYQLHVIQEAFKTGKGGVGAAICAQAEKMSAAAVVLSSHSRGGLGELLLGSVANYLIHKCSKPVAVLHGGMINAGNVDSWKHPETGLQMPTSSVQDTADKMGAAFSRGVEVLKRSTAEAAATAATVLVNNVTKKESSSTNELSGTTPVGSTAASPTTSSYAGGTAAAPAASADPPSTPPPISDPEDPDAAAAAPPFTSRHILIPVDASDESLATCKWTLDNLYKKGDMICLVHIIPCLPPTAMSSYPPFDTPLSVGSPWPAMILSPNSTSGPTGSQPVPDEVAEKEEVEWKQSQMSRFTEVLERHGVKYTFDVIAEFTQDPVISIGEELCVMASHLNAAAVIMSTHQRSALSELLFGSVTTYVSHHSDKPVVVLHNMGSGFETQGAAIQEGTATRVNPVISTLMGALGM